MSKALWTLLQPALLAACADAEPPAPAIIGPRIVDDQVPVSVVEKRNRARPGSPHPDVANRELAKMLEGEPDGAVRNAIRDAMQAVARRR